MSDQLHTSAASLPRKGLTDGILWIESRLGPRADLDRVMKGKTSPPFRESYCDRYPEASCTAWAMFFLLYFFVFLFSPYKLTIVRCQSSDSLCRNKHFQHEHATQIPTGQKVSYWMCTWKRHVIIPAVPRLSGRGWRPIVIVCGASISDPWLRGSQRRAVFCGVRRRLWKRTRDTSENSLNRSAVIVFASLWFWISHWPRYSFVTRTNILLRSETHWRYNIAQSQNMFSFVFVKYSVYWRMFKMQVVQDLYFM
jgi:hypothetical protein